MRKMISMALATAVSAAALFVAPTTHAGSPTSGPIASCTKNADGSGQCYGNLEGFLHSSGATDAAAFTTYDFNYASFWARVGTSFYSCGKSTPTQAWYQTASMPQNEFFGIQWNAAGQCTELNLETASFN